MASAHLERAAVNLKLHRPKDSLTDLTNAAAAPAAAADTHYRRVVVYAAMIDRPTAVTQLRECLRMEPEHTAAGQLIRQLVAK